MLTSSTFAPRWGMMAAVTMSLAGVAGAQCLNPDWLAGEGVPGIQGLTDFASGTVGEVNSSVLWDPDGPGPQAAKLVVGGTFAFAGRERANSVAVWDGTAWSSLGSGMDGPVLGLAALPNGQLVAGGFFTNAGGVPANNIAVWTGAAWSSLGDGLNSVVTSIVVLPDGQLVVGGGFDIAGGTALARGVARWDGAEWFAINQGLRAGAVGNDPGFCGSLARLDNGDIVVGGVFDRAGGVEAANIARLSFGADGTTSSWLPYGTGTDGFVSAIEAIPGGGFVAGGSFVSAGGTGVNYIAMWNGSEWSALGGGTDDAVVSIKRRANGDIIAGGVFESVGGEPIRGLARWDGSGWSALGDLNRQFYSTFTTGVYSLQNLPNGDLVAGGVIKGGVMVWNGVAWSNFGTGFNTSVSKVAALSGGDLIATGNFTAVPGAVVSNIARLHNGAWSGLGSGLDYVPIDLLEGQGGELIAAGLLVTGPSTPPVGRVDRWNGVAWEPLSSGFRAFALTRLADGTLVAAGNASGVGGVYRWTGSSWILRAAALHLATASPSPTPWR